MNSFNVSFNVMLGLHEKLGNVTRIVDEGEATIGTDVKAVGKELGHVRGDIQKLLSDFISSKRTQFLQDTASYYQTKSRALFHP